MKRYEIKEQQPATETDILNESIRIAKDWISRTDDKGMKEYLLGQLVALECEKIRLNQKHKDESTLQL